jgi:hypothetical protein
VRPARSLAASIALALSLGLAGASCGPEVRATPPRVAAFLDAAVGVDHAAKQTEADLVAACTDVGKSMGMAEVDLKVATSGGGRGAEAVCSNVAAKIGALLRASHGAELVIVADQPRCRVEVEAARKCLDACVGQPVALGDLAATCGGELSGHCSGQCKGSCAMPAGACSGLCRGTCSGKCDAGFSGTCGGRCDGTCNGKLSHGPCRGRCEGKCVGRAEGSCSGGCAGKCSATCDQKTGESCGGACTGGCSTPLEGATCTGDLKPPGVDEVCTAACNTKAALAAACDAPKALVTVKGKATPPLQKLAAALNAALPKILAVQYGAGQRLVVAATSLSSASEPAKDAALRRGQRLGGCAVAAGNAASVGASSLRVEVSASATLSAAAGALPRGG